MDFVYKDGHAETIIHDHKYNIDIVGLADCHPEDNDFENSNTGLSIASKRAFIKWLCFNREEIRSQYNYLKHLVSCMEQSPKYNSESYENKFIAKQLKKLEDELYDIRLTIEEERKDLRDYIKQKDTFYNTTRRNRRIKELEAMHEQGQI